MNRDPYYSTKDSGRDHPHQTSMNAPALHSPSTMYPNHPPPPYSHSSGAPPSAHSISGLISPTVSHPSDSRRTSGDSKDPSQAPRQSLPSIHEALYTPSTVAPPRNTTDPSSTRPYAFPQPPPTPTSRANSMDTASYQVQPAPSHSQRSSPPHPVHPTPFSRVDPMTPSYDSPRHPALPSLRTALPQQPTINGGPPSEYLRHERDPRVIAPVSNGYSHAPAHHGQHHGQATSGLAGPSTAYSPQSPYPPQRPYRSRFDHGDEHTKIGENPPTQKVYGPVVKRHLEYWDIEIELNNVRSIH